MSERLGILWFVLDKTSAARLRTAVPARYQHEYYHHVTLRYGVPHHAVQALIGQRHTITAYAVAHNDNAQACRVQTHGLPDTYGVPHVTVSTAPGIKPYASVAMLQAAHTEAPLDPPIELSGSVTFAYFDQVKD